MRIRKSLQVPVKKVKTLRKNNSVLVLTIGSIYFIL